MRRFISRHLLRFLLYLCLGFLSSPSLAQAQQKWAKGEQELLAAAEKLVLAGRPAEAVPLGEKRLEIAQSAFGAESDNAVTAMTALALYCSEAGDTKRARDLFKRAIDLTRKLFGKGDMWILMPLRGLGKLEGVDGNYDEALPLQRRALKAAEEVFGKNHVGTAAAIEDLAQTLTRKGDYAAALPLFQRVLKMRESLLGKEHAGVANALMNLSIAQKELGQLNEAELSLTRAIAIHEKVSGAYHPSLASALKNLGEFYMAVLLDYARAGPPLERALDISAGVLGPDAPKTIIARHALGLLRKTQRKFDIAEPLLRAAWASAKKTWGPDDPTTAKIAADLGSLLSNLNRSEEAIPLLSACVDVMEKQLGPEAARLFLPINNLAEAVNAAGQHAKAETLLRRALALAVKHYGQDSTSAAVAESNLVWCLNSQDKTEEARKLAARHVDYSCRQWEKLLSFGSEEQLEQSFRSVHNDGVGESLNDPVLAATLALRFKDSLVGALLENQRRVKASAKGSATTKLAATFSAAQARLRELVQQQAPEASLAKARAEAEAAEKALARKISGLGLTRSALKVTPDQVAAVLPSGTVLVEFSFHLIMERHRTPGQEVPIAYTAILISKSGEPKLVRLGEGWGIEDKINAFLKLISEPPADATDAALNAAAEKSAKELYSLIMAPIVAALPADTRTLVLSPDAGMYLAPFAAFMDAEGRFLVEKYALRQVSNGRDLLTAPRVVKEKTVLLLGNPDYQKTVKETSSASDPKLAELGRGMSFEPLPGTAAEIEGLSAQFSAQKWKVQVISGSAATEASVMRAAPPAVLHLATHGFFLDPRQSKSVLPGTGNSIFARSMANNGLVFAGGDSTVHQWAKGRLPQVSEDGILTAAEATGMNLEKTQLVTLSACETGLGATMSGYGVAGLKRALIFAGAQNLLTTLWKVNDEETTRFMTAFYTRFLNGEDPGSCLTNIQAEHLKQLREKHGIWFAINGAAPFVVTATSRWE